MPIPPASHLIRVARLSAPLSIRGVVPRHGPRRLGGSWRGVQSIALFAHSIAKGLPDSSLLLRPLSARGLGRLKVGIPNWIVDRRMVSRGHRLANIVSVRLDCVLNAALCRVSSIGVGLCSQLNPHLL